MDSIEDYEQEQEREPDLEQPGPSNRAYVSASTQSIRHDNNDNFAELGEDVLTPDANFIGLPRLPEIPELILCLHFPGTEGWHNHWLAFNKKVKDFHQSMIDFNWRVLEWYSIKSKQLERFGVKVPYVAGTLITGPRMTIIQATTLTEQDILCEVKKCLPDNISKEVKQLEKNAYKLCLSGKIFLFDFQKAVVVDYTQEADKSYRNCLQFSLFYKNQKVNIFEQYNRVYGGLKYSFIVGGIGGLIVSFLTGYFDSHSPPMQTRPCCPEPSTCWKILKRLAATSTVYSIIERVLLLKFPQPQKCIISGSTGAICGTLIGLCDNCDLEQTIYAASEFGAISLLCSAFLKKQFERGTLQGECGTGECS